MTVRPERQEEFSVIYDLVRVAFETAAVRDGDEQDYVDRLRASDAYLPDLALVACEGDRLVGHIMLTRVRLGVDDGREVRCLLLAPLSVVLDRRGRGVGGALVREALRLAAGRGYEAVFLAGDPVYYGRFGFRAAAEYGVVYTGSIPAQFILAYELRPGALAAGAINIEEAGS